MSHVSDLVPIKTPTFSVQAALDEKDKKLAIYMSISKVSFSLINLKTESASIFLHIDLQLFLGKSIYFFQLSLQKLVLVIISAMTTRITAQLAGPQSHSGQTGPREASSPASG